MRLLLVLLLVAPGLAPGLAHASALGDAVSGQAGAWLLFAALIGGLFLLGALCRQASAYLSERVHASRVARLMDVLASQAEGIAGLLLTHPPTPGATLQAVREAAIAQSVAYARVNMPDTLAAIGVTDGVLAARLSNEVAGKLLGAAPAVSAIAGTDAAADTARNALTAATPQPAANPAG